MTYSVKEIFYTLQGEGANTGRPAVFLRFAGCNLWSGREADRATAVCRFCDTDFVGTDGTRGAKYDTAAELAAVVEATWPLPPSPGVRRFVVCTGGEPLLQLDAPLVEALHGASFEIAIETNGTRLLPPGIDWVCVSPKARADLRLIRGDELKLVYPQEGEGGDPARYEHLDFRWFYLSPMDGPEWEHNTQLTLRYCLEHPRWRMNVQIHKYLGIR